MPKLSHIMAAVLLGTLPLSPIAFAQDEQKPAESAEQETDLQAFDRQMGNAEEQMMTMQSLMEKMQAAKTRGERHQLMRDHWQAMQKGMAAMHGMMGRSMPGCGMGPGQGMGHGMGMMGQGKGQGMMNGQGKGMMGQGSGQGMGPGAGKGQGMGMGNPDCPYAQGGMGQGMGMGQGKGMGQGMGQGMGRGMMWQDWQKLTPEERQQHQFMMGRMMGLQQQMMEQMMLRDQWNQKDAADDKDKDKD